MATDKSYSYNIVTRDTKRKGVVYDVRFRAINSDGRETQKRLSGYASKSLAKKAYMDFMTTYAPPPKVVNCKETLIFDDIVKVYLNAMQNANSESTTYDKRNVFARFIIPYFKGSKMSYFTKQNLYQFQDWLWSQKNNGETYAYRYLSKVWGYIGNFLAWCSDRYDVENNFKGLKKPRRQTAPTEMKILEVSDIFKLLNTIESVQWRTFFTILFFAGPRVSEVVAMSDDKIADGKITISCSITRKTTDGTPYKITIVKNKKNRTNALSDIVSQQVDVYKKWKKENGISSKFLFGGDKPISENSYQRAFAIYSQQADVQKIRIHDCRHSYVSMLIHLGVSFAVIADLIGDTLEQVVKTYGHMYVSDKEKVALLIDEKAKNYGTNYGTN